MDLLLKQSPLKCKALVCCNTSAPGSLMLFGEHAVLQGKLAISCAIDRRITIELVPRSDEQIRIHTSLGRETMTLHTLQRHPELSFVTEAICSFGDALPSGFDLHITSNFSHTMGLGSSSAVTVATVAVLQQALSQPYSPHVLFEQVLCVVRAVQGHASGADVAAAVFGGVVAYRMNPLTIEPLNTCFPITLLYSGSKLATRTVIKMVLEKQNAHPELYAQIFNAMEEVSLHAKEAIVRQQWDRLGILANTFHGLMDALGVCNEALSACCWTLRRDAHITGAKISGSGLGDCVVGIGDAPIPGRIPVEISLKGVQPW